MKRSFTILTAAIALLAFLAIPMGMSGQIRADFEFNLNQLYQNETLVTAKTVITEAGGTLTFTDQNENFTILITRNSGNQPGFYTSSGYIRFYTNDTFKLSAADGITMTKIVVTPNGSNFSVNSMTGLTVNTRTWEGSASEVTFTGAGTNKWDKLTITYSDGSTPQPTTYTVTYDCNGGTSGCPENVTGLEAGEEITLADGPVKTDYDFAGWSDGNNTYEEGDEYTVNGNVTFTAQWNEVVSGDEHWVLAELADLTSTDVFVIVGNNGSNYAMSNDNGTGTAPSTVAVTVANDEITSTVAANIQWNISGNATNGYTFYPNGSTTTWLYCTNVNNGVRVGTNTGKTFVIDATSGYLKHNATSRYVGIYSSQDWRCYTSYTTTNIANQTFAFYKKVTGGVVPPTISASNVEIAYNATSGNIAYIVNNEPTPAGTITAAIADGATIADLSLGAPSDGMIAFTCAANATTTAHTATVTLTYTYGDNETVSKDVTVTQAAAPLIYTTIPALFEAATNAGNTATDVTVTFGNWVVTGANNSSHTFVSDGTNGFMIYQSGHGFSAGDVLSGTVECKVQLYNGAIEITQLTSTTTGLTVTAGGAVTVANIAMADLAGINTGALVSYQNLTCEARAEGNYTNYYLSDGTTEIQAYKTLFNDYANYLEDGKTYNITGVFVLNNSTKRINPRSAADIEEVGGAVPSIAVTPSLVDVNAEEHEGTLALAYENIEEFISFDYYFCDANGGELEEDPDWIYAEIQEGNDTYSLYYLIDANDGAARTAYLKVYTFDDNLEEVYALVTVNQEEYVAPGVEENYMLFTGDLVEGDYLIVYDGSAMNNVVDNGRLQYEEVTVVDDVIITDNAAIVWHIAPSGDYWTIYSADANAYAASTGVKNKAQMLADGTDNMALWTVNLSNGTFDFVNKANDAANVNAYLRNNKNTAQNYGFACYGSGTGGALSLYKKVDGNTPSITVNPALVEEDVEEHDGTLDLTYVNLEITDMEDFGIQYYDAEGEETDEPDWIEVLVAEQDPTIGEGYVVSYYMLENDGQARTAYFKVFALGDEDFVYSNLITINQAGYVAPAGSNDFQLYSGALVEGDYLIVYDNGAMNTTENNNRLQFSDVYPINDLITTDDASIIWHIAPSGNYWTIYNADENAYAASTGIKNQAQMLSDGTDDMALWTVSTSEGTYEFENKERAGSSSNPNNKWLRRNGDFGFACYSTSIGGALSLYKRLDAPVTEAHTLTINAYTNDNTKDGYNLIASPVNVNPATVAGMTEGDFDLYSFDESQEDEWRNYEATAFNLVPGKGYLYAKKAATENQTYSFELTGIPYNNEPIILSKSENGDFPGWNLVGNPFGETAVLSDNRDFYVMNSDGSDFIQGSGDIAPMQGIFVIADQNEDVLVFTPVGSIGTGPIEDFKLVLNLTKGRGIIDRAVVRFGEGRTLPKFMLNANNTKLYITEGNQDYAVVRSNNAGEMPVSFKAAENGNYTLSIETENVEVSYLHLIDNMTGTDVDLMATPSYSFEARTTDYANRFRLVFNTNGVDENTTTASFAYFNGSSWTISTMGEATLQVVDMMGRVISTQAISGNTDVNLNQATGVYMLRLVNGENVMVQKVVVR